jgi:uncharacterized membrane protein YbaN (DUF454 family)
VEPVAQIPSVRPATAAWKRWLYVPAGCALVALAAVGLFLPVLPTTPLLLLASACFIRSWPRANSWLLHSRLFGPAIQQWQARRAVHRWVKLLAMAAIVASVALVLARPWHWAAQVATVGLCLVGLVVVARLPVIGRSA